VRVIQVDVEKKQIRVSQLEPLSKAPLDKRTEKPEG